MTSPLCKSISQMRRLFTNFLDEDETLRTVYKIKEIPLETLGAACSSTHCMKSPILTLRMNLGFRGENPVRVSFLSVSFFFFISLMAYLFSGFIYLSLSIRIFIFKIVYVQLFRIDANSEEDEMKCLNILIVV